MYKVVTIVGARPQFVKAAVLSRVLRSHSDVHEILVHTGQHFDANMSDIFFEEMEIPKPDYHLGIDSLSHGAMTGRMLEAIEGVLQKEAPDVVVVYGDTNSTLAGALAAKKMHIPVAHIEAGLRSYNELMPEEVNRILTDRISDYLFCPTQTAVNNLAKEGYSEFDAKVELVGDIMFDAVEYYSPKAKEHSTLLHELELEDGNFVLATVHRQVNTKVLKNLVDIVAGLKAISLEKQVVWPIHPHTYSLVKKHNIDTGTILVIDPVGYFDMLALLMGCYLVVTDSGGLQKEAYFFKKFCITIREQTEWVELIEHGCNVLTKPSADKIMEAWTKAQENSADFNRYLYGRGNAGNIIVEKLKSIRK